MSTAEIDEITMKTVVVGMAVLAAFLRKSPKRTSQLLLFLDGSFYGKSKKEHNTGHNNG